MKICLIGRYNTSEKLNGPEKFAKRLLSNLIKKNSDVIFIEYFFKDYVKGNLFKRIFGHSKISSALPVYQLGIFQIFKTIFLTKPDIIHIVTMEYFVLTILLIKPFLNSKIVITTHGLIRHERSIAKNKGVFSRYFIATSFERLLFMLVDEQVFVSNILLDLSQKYYGNIVKKTKIIRNGIDEIFYRRKVIRQFGNKIKIVFYLGDPYSIDRGLTFLLNSFKKMGIEKFEIYLIGEKINFQEPWNKVFISVPVMKTKKLVEFLSDKNLIFKSNTFDSFPIFVIECMSLGLIPIVSDATGSKEIIINHQNGFIYNSKDQKSLINLLNELHNNKYNLEEISIEASKIYQNYNWDKITEEYNIEYKKLSTN